MSAQEAATRGLTPLAKVICHTSYATAPEWFTLAPTGAVKKLCALMRCKPVDIPLYEINEAFATVTMAALKDLHLSHAQVNIYGGACALGHPIGASGARLVVTLIYALQAQKLSQGIASLCIGGGEATAIALENVFC
jgi:acetyl-CoA C-acetyltransferase